MSRTSDERNGYNPIDSKKAAPFPCKWGSRFTCYITRSFSGFCCRNLHRASSHENRVGKGTSQEWHSIVSMTRMPSPFRESYAILYLVDLQSGTTPIVPTISPFWHLLIISTSFQLIPRPAHALRLLSIVIYSQLQWDWRKAIDKLPAQGKRATNDTFLEHYAGARLRVFLKLAEDIHGATQNVKRFRRFADLSKRR